MNASLVVCVACVVSFVIAGCGGGLSEGSSPPQLEPGQVIPSDVLTPTQRINFAVSPARFQAALGWAEAVTLSKNQAGDIAVLEMDYLRLLEEVNPTTGTSDVVAEAAFETASPHLICIVPSGRCDGALYQRDPWFGTDDHSEMTNSVVANGNLQIDLAQTPNRVAHWWTPRALQRAPNRRYFVETRFRVTGKAAVRLGVDYWIGLDSAYNGPQDQGCQLSNNCQAWASIWFGDTGGIFVTKKVPIF